MRTANAPVSLRMYADSPNHSLLADAIITDIPRTDPFLLMRCLRAFHKMDIGIIANWNIYGYKSDIIYEKPKSIYMSYHV